MKKIAVLIFPTLVFIGCNATNQQSVNISTQNPGNSTIVSSHSSENQPNPTIVPKSETRTKWTQSGTPIDTKQFDDAIAKAEKDLKDKPKDEAAKKSLAEAYVNRGLALTDARQYASALGDYRRALKYDANNDEAKKWIDQIIEIYDGLNKDYPKEGEEPPPLPFKQETNSTGERINFSQGATSAIAAGNLKNYDDSKTFLLEVKAGQTLKTEQIKDDKSLQYITVQITDPNGKIAGDSDASCNNRKEIKPTVAGDYRIKVVECMKADAWQGDFKLKVSAE